MSRIDFQNLDTQIPSREIQRVYLRFGGKYEIYFIECVENIRIYTSAQHE